MARSCRLSAEIVAEMSHVPTTFGKTGHSPKKAAAARRFGFARGENPKQIVAHHVRLRDYLTSVQSGLHRMINGDQK